MQSTPPTTQRIQRIQPPHWQYYLRIGAEVATILALIVALVTLLVMVL